MATSSIGRKIVIDTDAADRMIAQIEEQDAKGNPPIPRGRIKWGNVDKTVASINRKYANAG
jgi:hypothetical protein